MEASSATVKEITPEEYERRQKEEQKKNQPKPEPAPKPKETPAPKKEDKKEDDEDKLQEGHIMPNKEKGSDKEKYSWGQMDIKEITITVPVPNGTRGKDMDIKYDNTHLHCAIKGQEPIIDGELFAPMKSDSFVWTLEEVRDKKVLVMTFEKAAQSWWENVLKNDSNPVDTRKVQPEASKISDIDDPELKAQVEKMMFDTRQKAMGKPTSDILQKAPQIEEFMRQHPEMDFSKATFNC
ncbi:MAG: NudC domain-containing protein [archaeon]|nr:NudC domain-containing protein [archaeon]